MDRGVRHNRSHRAHEKSLEDHDDVYIIVVQQARYQASPHTRTPKLFRSCSIQHLSVTRASAVSCAHGLTIGIPENGSLARKCIEGNIFQSNVDLSSWNVPRTMFRPRTCLLDDERMMMTIGGTRIEQIDPQ
jgi:hypothetical protein